ncbi:Hpr(Ser) kinase/phosphatase [Sulfuritortus calidifontis]|uniref:HPr kinase/phosphorylase n=1 Tax=Sulfuritortus calidifontis TaxID=1914471 RepID=A0A4R3JT44_9PROT|nr:HPr(Ser) kinase/phosphatase [Sulfuritortus calidifontis]TCS70452.1 Hpr(Ser) kinase/phosphatase [Sulfuritortus calidifontis]
MDSLSPFITVDQLYELAREQVPLDWVAGRAGGGRKLTSDSVEKSAFALIGYFNLVHPNRIQILGNAEMGYLRSLPTDGQALAINNLLASELAVVVVANGEQPPPTLLSMAEERQIPVFVSPESSTYLMRILSHVISQALAVSVTLHGVFLEVAGLGVLITGAAATGKSELALELISRGHRLVADDILEVYAVSPDTLEGRCPELLRGFMEVRGLGVLDIRRLFGEAAVKFKKNLKLIVHLTPAEQWQDVDRLAIQSGSETILGVEIPKVSIPLAVGRNLAVLVEVAVRNHILRQHGINSTEEFVNLQHQAMQGGEG